MGDVDKIAAIFQEMSKETEDNAIAAALLTLCVSMEGISERLSERLSHDISTGLRKGLFGVNDPEWASIRDLFLNLTGAMEMSPKALEGMQLHDVAPNEENSRAV